MVDETTSGDERPAEESQHDLKFFLKLAREGKDKWNKWRQSHKGVPVTFADVDFSEAPWDEIDFSGFEFGDGADFSRCKWRGAEGVRHFEPGRAFFTGAAFGHFTLFVGAIFGDRAGFEGAAFGDYASFVGAAFGRNANFGNAAFCHEAKFTRATFGDDATFAGAAFGWGAGFDDTIFKGLIVFVGKTEEQWTRSLVRLRGWDEGARIALEKRHKESWKRNGSGPDHFSAISFANARFYDVAMFSSRSFEQTADFSNARFYSPPDFVAVTKASRIDLTGAHIGFARPGRLHWTLRSSVPVRLRVLRNIAEDTKNHDLERDLYIEERKAERGVYLVRRFLDWVKDPKKKWALIAHLFWIVVMGVYWALADYGRSFVRPAGWLVASVYFFDRRYTAVLEKLMAKATDVDKYEQALGMLALGNAVPFLGPLTIDPKIKEFLFCAGEIAAKCTPIPPEGFQCWVIAQNLLSIILVFFIGLALRNYFRIK